jgi:anaerobic selenocysteine-containing dehydrogenase
MSSADLQSPQPPLVCISPPAHSFLNSSFGNVPRFLQREGTPVLQIHPDDAARRGIAAGDQVCVANAQGEVRLTAVVTTDIVPGTVLAPGVWWPKHSPDRRNINQVTLAEETDMGASGMFYDAAVLVTPVVAATAAQDAALAIV